MERYLGISYNRKGKKWRNKGKRTTAKKDSLFFKQKYLKWGIKTR